VPTKFDLTTEQWGYEVTPDMIPLKWFKLLLLKDEDVISREILDSEPLQQARQQLRAPGAPSPTQVVGKYLGKLWKHTYAQLKSRIDIESLPIKVAITVPAIWPPYAEQAMRKAAKLAKITVERDMGYTTLDLVQEPEAAGLSSLFKRGKQPDVKPGDSFVVCDAGGGTVDCISYTVQSTSPFKLEECVQGAGKLSGAYKVDEAFEKHLLWKTKLKLHTLPDSDYNVFVLQDWELGAKRAFADTADPPNFILRPPVKAFKRMDRWKGKGDITLSRDEMRGFFGESMMGIRRLVSDQYNGVRERTGKPPKASLAPSDKIDAAAS
jgi:hypothetical protein